MRNYDSASTDREVQFDNENMNVLFTDDNYSHDGRSHFTIARDLQLSIGIISEIDSIEMEEGFIY